MNKNLLILTILFVMALVYTIGFMIFNTVKANLSRENPNKKAINFWTILTFVLGYFCFVASILVATFLIK